VKWRKPKAVAPPRFALPTLYDAAETESRDQQRYFFLARGCEFTALVIAAIAGLMPSDWLGGAGPIVAVGAFGVALLVRLSGWGDQAEKRWYDARAACESIKSASWQYAVCGESYRHGDATADSRFKALLKDVLKALPKLDVAAEPGGEALTSEMKQLRSALLKDRVEAYRDDRVDDQLTWYSAKATKNKRRALQSTGVLISVEALAVVLGLLRIKGVFDVDWLSVLAAAAASLAAWKQTKNYTSLSEAYAVTSHEVQRVKADLDHVAAESGWAQFVHDAEAAFSREHTLWLARRQGPQAPKRS
jgi:hypothetical protein